jgi:hypothetical protein
MKTFEEFNYEDVDPLGEENWDDFEIGDDVKALKNISTYINKKLGTRIIFVKGNVYKIRSSQNSNFPFSITTELPNFCINCSPDLSEDFKKI